MRLLLLLCICLFPILAFAQTTISGRVLEAKSKYGLPGATVLQTGTTNGTSSDVQGYFSFTVPGQPDSVALTVSSIGCTTVRRVVVPGSNLRFRLTLEPDNFCDLQVFTRYRLSLLSGLRYTPAGGSLTFSHSQILRGELSTTAGYQTDFLRNHIVGVSLGLPSIHQHRRTSFSESIAYTKLHVPTANVAIEGIRALMGIHSRNSHWPSLYGGLGFGRLRAFTPESFASSTGAHYALGLGKRLPFDFAVNVQATRWPNAWQWQGSLNRELLAGLQGSLSLNYLRSYQEISVSLSRSFR